jgi:hypothetical protein
MKERITIEGPDGAFAAYIARPKTSCYGHHPRDTKRNL